MKEKSLRCVSMPIQTRQNLQRQSGGGEVILKKISETRKRTNPNPHLCFLMRNSSHAISLLTPVLPWPPRPVFVCYNFWDIVMEVKSKLEILSQHSRCCLPFPKQEADIATFIYKCRNRLCRILSWERRIMAGNHPSKTKTWAPPPAFPSKVIFHLCPVISWIVQWRCDFLASKLHGGVVQTQGP